MAHKETIVGHIHLTVSNLDRSLGFYNLPPILPTTYALPPPLVVRRYLSLTTAHFSLVSNSLTSSLSIAAVSKSSRRTASFI